MRVLRQDLVRMMQVSENSFERDVVIVHRLADIPADNTARLPPAVRARLPGGSREVRKTTQEDNDTERTISTAFAYCTG